MKRFKKALCIALSGILLLGLAGCGKNNNQGGSGGGAVGGAVGKTTGKTTEAKKNPTDNIFGVDDSFDIGEIEGEIGDFFISGDKIYLVASKWVEDEFTGDGTVGPDGMTSEDSEKVEENEAAEETETVEEKESSEEKTVSEEKEAAEELEESEEKEVSEELEVSEESETLPLAEKSELSGKNEIRIYSVSIDGGTPELLYESDMENGTYISNIFGDKDGNPLFYVDDYDYDSGDSESKICELKDGKLAEKIDITNMAKNAGEDYLNRVYAAGDDFIGAYDRKVVIYDSNINEKKTIDSEDYIEAVGFDKDNNLVIVANNYNEETEESKCILKKYNMETGEKLEEFDLNVSYLSGYDSLYTGTGEYDLFYKTSSAIYGFKYADKKETKVADLAASDISEYVSDIYILDENTFFCSLWDWNEKENSSNILKYNRLDPSEIADREILTLVSLYGNYSLKNAVTDYNKSQDKIKIRFIEYGEESNPEQKLSADIAAGEIPDMFDLSYGVGNMSVDQCIAKGLFEDITPYIENDSEISKEDFIPSAYESMLSEDGKLYYLSEGFLLYGLMGKASEIGGEPGWTFGEMKEYVESKPQGAKIFYSDNKSDILESFMYGCGGDFVDWSKGEAYFDTQDFKDVLEMCNRGSNDEMNWEEEMPSTYSMIKSGDMLFLDGSITMDDCIMNKKLFDDDFVVKGYPNKDKKGIYFSFINSIAMSSKCTNKDAAWDFMRKFMTEDFQGKHYKEFYGIPTREDVYDEYVKSLQCTEEYQDKYGNDIYPLEGGYSWEDLEVEIKPLSQEEVDYFRKLIDQASGVWESDSSIREIVMEEAASYFAGDKSVDDVCTIIQNRVTTYVNENK